MLNLFRRLLEQNNEGDGGVPRGPGPADGNAARQRARIDRMARIARTADAQRSAHMMDVDGDGRGGIHTTGRFAGGEFDDSPEAREQAALREEDLARQSLEEQQERERESERLEQEEARRLQSEGGTGDDSQETPPERSRAVTEEGDERVIDGVRYYRTILGGIEKWLTAKELRELAATASNAEATLQRAEEALRSAASAELTPKAGPAEIPSEEDLENIILSASMGDEEAVKKLASIVRARPPGVDTKQVSSEVARQIATQREVDRAEATQADLLDNEQLAPIFRMRLNAFAQAKPKTRISEAYQSVGDQMRKDFAPMLKSSSAPPSKNDRKRTIVNPPQSAGRQPQRGEDDREVPVSEDIDAMARARGQQRAHRIRRS